jgi:uncharacterized protein (TIGR03083 family)
MLRLHTASEPELVRVWHDACTELRAVATEEAWDRPSILPGWTVGDIIAHTAWIERLALGRFDPAHEPDWAALPHAVGDFGRATEVPVDLRRSWTREQVLAEFEDAVAARLAALQSMPPGATDRNVFGKVRPLTDILRMRIFDLWVHQQDVATGGLDSDAAQVAADRMVGALGYVWAKQVAAPTGSTLVVDCTGPGVVFTEAVVRGEDGKGAPVEPPARPTVRLTMTFPNYVALACGRATADAAAVRIDGDEALGRLTLERFGIAP